MLLIRVLCLIALAASAALYVDYTTAQATFCGPGSGCAAVRRSGFGYLFGFLPVPVIGLVGFGSILVVTCSPKWERVALTPLALVGGLAALAFVVVQAVVIRAFCWLCVTADFAGLLIAAAALLRDRSVLPGSDLRFALAPAAWLILGLLSAAVPIAWARVKPQPAVPNAIRELYAPGKINVVEFADFQCPFCRALHPRLKALTAEYGERVHVVRMQMPLASHEYAHGAALAAVCGDLLGKGEAMTDALFATDDLRPESLRAVALKLGLPAPDYDRCVAGAEARARVEREAKVLRDSGFLGLPTVYIGGKMIVGAQPDDVFRDALERAGRGADEAGVSLPVFALLSAVAAGLVIAAGRRRDRAAPPV